MNKEINVILYYTIAFQWLFQILLDLSIVSLCLSKVFNRIYRMLIYVHYSLLLWCEIIKLFVHARSYCFFWARLMCRMVMGNASRDSPKPSNHSCYHNWHYYCHAIGYKSWLLRTKSCCKPCLPFLKLRHNNTWK
jgi:hypothetical protein